jgi:hypothetical protein
MGLIATEEIPMNKKLYFACSLLFVAAFSLSALSHAQSPFDGTWRTNMATAKLTPKPNVFYLSQGWYHCVTCSPVVEVRADGTDQPVTGQAYDTVSVKEVDDKTIETVTKKAGKVVAEQTRTVSKDGKTLTVKTTNHPMNSDKPITAESVAKLVGIAPAGVHATSGTWKIEKVTQSDNGLLFTLKATADELTYSDPTGEGFAAKFDGTDASVKGAYAYNTVSLKKVNASTIEETFKRDSTVVLVAKLTVSGKTLTREVTNKLTDRTNTYTATKQ